MQKLTFLVLIGSLLSSACQAATPAAVATSTSAPTSTAIPTETFTPVPTAESTPTLESIHGGWSMFYTQKYGFQFLYPAVYDQGFYDPADPLTFCNVQTKEEDGQFNVWVGFVRVVVSKTDQGLQDVSDKYAREVRNKGVDWKILSQTQVRVDHLPAMTIEYDRQRPARWGSKTFLIHDNDLLTIDYYEAPFASCSPLGIDYSSYWVYQQIINTLKFDK